MDPNDLKKPVYNSSLKLIKQIDDLKSTKKDDDVSINESAIERINEKVSVKLNVHDQLYSGLAPVAPQDEDFNQFMRILEAEKKLKPKVKPSTNLIKVPYLFFYVIDPIYFIVNDFICQEYIETAGFDGVLSGRSC